MLKWLTIGLLLIIPACLFGIYNGMALENDLSDVLQFSEKMTEDVRKNTEEELEYIQVQIKYCKIMLYFAIPVVFASSYFYRRQLAIKSPTK